MHYMPLDRSKPLSEQIYRFFRNEIIVGRLGPGTRLPSSRELSGALAVSRNTVLGAYDHLLAEGYIEGRGARGTFVSEDIPEEDVAGTIRAPRAVGSHARTLRAHQAGRCPPGRGRDSGRRAHPIPGIETVLDQHPEGTDESSRGTNRLSRYGAEVLRRPSVYSPFSQRDTSRLQYDFRHNVIVGDPASERSWNQIVRRLLREDLSEWPGYTARDAGAELQQVLAEHLRTTRGVRCRPEQVQALIGPQHAMHLVADLLLDPGDRVAIEEAHYLGARHVFLSRGAELVPVPVDRNGMQVGALPEFAGGAKLVYVAPSHQWPTGGVLPFGRRRRLLQWVEENDAFVIENDHNFEYRYEGPPVESLQGLDGGRRVFYVGTFFRLTAPGLRVGYLVVPQSMIEAVQAAVTLSGTLPSPLERRALAAFLSEGHLARLNRRARRRGGMQREAMTKALARHLAGRVETTVPSTGFHVRVTLPGWSVSQVDALVERAAKAGIGIYPDHPFFLETRLSPVTADSTADGDAGVSAGADSTAGGDAGVSTGAGASAAAAAGETSRSPGLLLGFGDLSPKAIRAGIRRFAEILSIV